jgi:hypothetical protein
MKRTLIMAAGVLTLALASVPASAMPALGGAAGAKSAASDVLPLTQVHYRHSVCRLGPGGWHRSYRWGRVRCVPVRFLRRY